MSIPDRLVFAMSCRHHGWVRSWFEAWAEAATGPAGFWRGEIGAAHFRTASSSTPLLARMLTALLAERPDITTVVEVGAGDGRLLAALRSLDRRRRLSGIDLRPPPVPLSGVGWRVGQFDALAGRWQGPPASLFGGLTEPALVLCCEWLDDLPCPVAVVDGGRWSEVLVDEHGREQLGDRADAVDRDWLDRWWPVGSEGDRAEAGRTRDLAWATVIRALRPSGGLALMIDYGHLRAARPAGGTLTGFVGGRQVPPTPTPAINLTAHVAVDAVAAAGEREGARTEFLIDQRTAVSRLLPPTPAGLGALGSLQQRAERRLLASVLGDHRWLLQSVHPIDRGARRTGPG